MFLCRYEDEINKRATAENEFVVLKKARSIYFSLCQKCIELLKHHGKLYLSYTRMSM